MKTEMISVKRKLAARSHIPLNQANNEREDRLQCILELSNSYYWEQNKEHCFTEVKQGEPSKTPIYQHHLLGKTHWSSGMTPVKNNGSWQQYKQLWENRKEINNFVVWYSDPQIGERFISISGKPIFGKHNEFKGYRGISKDITDQKLRERYNSNLELLAIGISHVNSKGQFIHVNKQMCEMLGYEREELLELTIYGISHPEDEGLQEEIKIKLQSGEVDTLNIEQRYIRKDNKPIWVRLTIAVIRGPDGSIINGVSMVEDISARKRAEERVQYLATHDEMTGLPNRVLFSQLLKHTLKSSERYERKFAILFIDLDRFKHINDSLGHDAGDILLIEMAKRFKKCLRASDVVARLGGDEFVILIPEIKDATQVEAVANNILTVAYEPLNVSNQECRVSASIGICIYPDLANNEQKLMQNADIAMYLAKEEGKNIYKFYTKDIQSHSVKKMEFESNLRRAVEFQEFEIYYQPRVNVKSGEVKGVEALLRWNNPTFGSVPPTKFIPITEETGLIVPLGKWVIRSACEQNSLWQHMGLPQVCISVNLSPRQFLDEDLLPFIRKVLAETKISPELLELEITESMVMHNTEQALEKLFEMKKIGIRIAIDDFGTGYSSLSQLKRFPVDTLKIDRSFIRELEYESEDQAITEAIIVMGKLLGLTVVAEGVETAEQQTFLSNHNCDEIQGFYFARPTPAQQFENLMRTYQPAILN